MCRALYTVYNIHMLGLAIEIKIDKYIASVVRPAKCVSLTSSPFLNAFLVTKCPLLNSWLPTTLAAAIPLKFIKMLK